MIYKRYVDDIFVLFSSKNHLHFFVDYMNSFSFLDIKITNNLKHLFIDNQILVVYLHTLKVIWVKRIKSH